MNLREIPAFTQNSIGSADHILVVQGKVVKGMGGAMDLVSSPQTQVVVTM